MDGQSKFLRITELKRELHSEGCSDDRQIEILAEIRKLDKPVKKPRKVKEPKERYMTVLGCYVLDMQDHGRLVGTRTMDGAIQDRMGRKIE